MKMLRDIAKNKNYTGRAWDEFSEEYGPPPNVPNYINRMVYILWQDIAYFRIVRADHGETYENQTRIIRRYLEDSGVSNSEVMAQPVVTIDEPNARGQMPGRNRWVQR